jgi:hypothetical protein
MNLVEANEILRERLDHMGSLEYHALAARIGEEEALEVKGETGVAYQAEAVFFGITSPTGLSASSAAWMTGDSGHSPLPRTRGSLQPPAAPEDAWPSSAARDDAGEWKVLTPARLLRRPGASL